MRPHASVAPKVVVVAVAALGVLVGCSDGDDDAARPDTGGPTTTVEAAGTARSGTATASSTPAATATVPTVPEAGVPGLESDQAVCRAWSRFGGSFQVVAVAASFGSGDPLAAFELEVIAAPTVTAAYAELVANWPAELAAEADPASADYFGPFARRADRALSALAGAGADETTMATIVLAWEAELAARDPAVADVTVELPGDVQAVVDAAAVELATHIVPIPSDPSLVTDVDVPLTEQYLADNCPDRGTLGGVDE